MQCFSLISTGRHILASIILFIKKPISIIEIGPNVKTFANTYCLNIKTTQVNNFIQAIKIYKINYLVVGFN